MPYIGQRPATGEHNSFKILDDISNYTLTFGSSDIDVSADTITAREHRFVTGQRVTYGNGGGTDPTGLSNGTVYYIIVEDRHTFKLATNAGNAVAGTAINITAAGSGAAHTINVAFDGVNTKFKATHTNGTKADISQSGQLMVSVNGVLQQPHDNTTTPTTGYATDHTSTIIFSAAPTAGDQFFGRLIASNFATFDISDNTVDNFTGDGNTSTFTLSKTPPNNESILVTIDGVVQYPDDNAAVRAYTVSENVLDFASAPGNSVEIQVRHIGFAGASTAAVSGFYGRTGNAALKSTDNIVFNNATAGIVTATNITVTGNLTVDGTTTTLDTELVGVDKLEVNANNTTSAGIITQTGSGDILQLYDGSTKVVDFNQYGNLSITSTNPVFKSKHSTGNVTTTLFSNSTSGVVQTNSGHDLVLATGAVEKVRITSNGKVGIGTTDPASLLHLENAAPVLTVKATNALSGLRVNVKGQSSGQLFRVQDDNTTKFVLEESGNVGIRTDNPEDELHIFLDSSSDGPSLRLTNPNGGDGTFTGRISTGDAAGTFFAGINFLKHDTNDGEIRLRTKVAGSNTDVVTIVDGNVGINSTAPTAKLDVSGNSTIDGNLTVGNSPFSASPGHLIRNVGQIVTRRDGSKAPVYSAYDGELYSSNIKIQFENDGSAFFMNDVGIGTATPGHKLEVEYTSDDDGLVINHANRGGKWRFATSGSNAELFDIRRYDGANSTFRRYLLFGPDQFSVYTGSTTSATERFRISSNGAVGIGTNSPDDRLHVLGGNIQVGKTEETGYETIIGNNVLRFNRTAASYIDQAGTGDIRFRYGASNNTWMHMEGSNGRIGIGTDNPYAKNHIEIDVNAGAGSGSAGALWLKNANQTANNSATIFFGNNASQAAGAINFIHKDYSTNAGDITFDTRTDGSTYAERLRIKSDGVIKFGANNSTTDYLEWGGNPRLMLQAPTGLNGLRIYSDTTPLEVAGSATTRKISMGGTPNYDLSISGSYSLSSGGHDSSPKVFLNATRHNGSTTVTSFQTSIQAVSATNTAGDGYLGLGASATPDDLVIRPSGNIGAQNTDPKSKVHIGGAIGSVSNDANTTHTSLIIKQSNNDNKSGFYIERSGERKGYYMWMNPGGGSGDGLTFTRNNNGTKSDAFILDRDANLWGGGTFYPLSDNSYDLGSASNRWRNVYTTDLQLSNEGSQNDVDGTWGSYTIQEGEDELFLINRRNGKKYKFNLTEVN